jgi:hypothetical protein
VTDRRGELAVAQWPNPALGVWAVELLLRLSGVLGATAEARLVGVGRGALLVWGVDEVLRGASPFRRLLGLGVLFFQVAAVFS